MKQLGFFCCLLPMIFMSGSQRVTTLVSHTHTAGNTYCTYQVDSVLRCKTAPCFVKGDKICILCTETQQGLCGSRLTLVVDVDPSGNCYKLSGIADQESCTNCREAAANIFRKK